jgi:hypothetical protein
MHMNAFVPPRICGEPAPSSHLWGPIIHPPSPYLQLDFENWLQESFRQTQWLVLQKVFCSLQILPTKTGTERRVLLSLPSVPISLNPPAHLWWSVLQL